MGAGDPYLANGLQSFVVPAGAMTTSTVTLTGVTTASNWQYMPTSTRTTNPYTYIPVGQAGMGPVSVPMVYGPSISDGAPMFVDGEEWAEFQEWKLAKLSRLADLAERQKQNDRAISFKD